VMGWTLKFAMALTSNRACGEEQGKAEKVIPGACLEHGTWQGASPRH
jgi:hypothetical protein